MKHAWIAVLPVVAALATSISVSPFSTAWDSELSPNLLGYLSFWGVVALFVSAVVVVVAHNMPSMDVMAHERIGMIGIKLLLIPFYLFGCAFYLAAFIVPGAVFIGIPLIAAIGYVIMLPGSVWAICYALSLKKRGVLGTGGLIGVVVLELCFVLDVIAAIVLFFYGLHQEKRMAITAEAGRG